VSFDCREALSQFLNFGFEGSCMLQLPANA
jgi:hypothetical protein